MDKKITSISLQVASNGSAFRLVFLADDGSGTPLVLTPDMLSNTVMALIEAGTKVPGPLAKSFTSDVPANPHPPHASGLGISPISDMPDHARLTVVSGIVNLQFALPIADLFQVLEDLRAATEPDPSSDRPN